MRLRITTTSASRRGDAVTEVPQDNAGVYFPPPLIFVAFFVAGWLARRWVPISIPYARPMGVIVAMCSIALLVWGFAPMHRARTAVIPHKPATQLVTGGAFRFTRNPLYVSMIIGYTSVAIWTEAVPALLLLPVAIAVLQARVIRREEAYLERRFGSDYREYCRTVRRWL